MTSDAETHNTNFKKVWDNQRFAKATSNIEGVTGIYAQHMIVQAGLRDYPKDSPLVVLDNACGGGILTLQLQALLQDRPQNTFQVTDGDLAEAMVGLASKRVEKEGWTNTTVSQINAESTGLPDGHFTHVLTNFGLMAFADPSKALNETHRILKPGGTNAFTTWGGIPWLAAMQEAMESVGGLPQLPAQMDVPNIFSKVKIWDKPELVRNYTAEHGFVDVESNLILATSVIKDPEELTSILKPPLTLMTRFFWTEEQRQEFDNEATQNKIFDWFEEKLKREGTIEWQWSAIVTSSKKPN